MALRAIRSTSRSTAAAKFFLVEVWTRSDLTRFLVFFLIHLSRRRVEIAGIATKTDGVRGNDIWFTRRDPLFTNELLGKLPTGGVTSARNCRCGPPI